MRCHQNRRPIGSLWESLHHCTISNYVKKVSQDNYLTMNAEPIEPLSNWQSKAIYPSSPIHANNLSLDKGPYREFTSARILTRRASGLGRRPVKKKSCQ